MKRLLVLALAPLALGSAAAAQDEGRWEDQALYASRLSEGDLAAVPVNALDITQAPVSSTPPRMPADLSPEGVRAADDHLALEEVDGAEALAFVAESNRNSLNALTSDPRYEPFRQQALAILTSQDRIPMPVFLGDHIANFWQDAEHPKGIWRRTTLESYRSGSPEWETLLDIDEVARQEGRDWVWKGAQCLPSDESMCLISLSDGGKDAVVVREFDTGEGTWVSPVSAGLDLPEGKHRFAWLDGNTLLVATDFGPDVDGGPTVTESGYPFTVRRMTRGQTLAEATEVYRGDRSDGGYGVSPVVYRDAAGAIEAVLFNRPLDTFRSETWWWEGDIVRNWSPQGQEMGSSRQEPRARKLDVPERLTIHGVQSRQLIVSPDELWERNGASYAPGSILSVSLDALDPTASPIARVVGQTPEVVFAPTDRQAVQNVAVLGNRSSDAGEAGRRIVVSYTDNVVGRLAILDLIGSVSTDPHQWRRTEIDVPDNSAINLGDSSKAGNRVFVTSQGFLTPQTLNLLTADGRLQPLDAAPALFDASTHVTEQFEARSSDGTMIPFFVTRPRDLAYDGSAPTILFGYGGFQISFPPAYKPEMGALWLQNGGVFVQANIRGGGEFGPAWHQAVLKEHRQLAFDDFAAVARDLQERGITSPEHLGIYGRSNGGVLTSVSVTQHPELFNAAVIESPLIDMLRYPYLPAGASWIGEYGDPRIPEEAAHIARYSGYQNVRENAGYPRLYITTNTRDDRVHPGHARKFAARLAEMGYGPLYYEETSGGHSNDADPNLNAARWARHYVYLSQQLMD